MSIVTIKMEVSPAEYAQITGLVREKIDSFRSDLRTSVNGYVEYRSAEQKEAGKPERMSEYSVRRARKSVAALAELSELATLLGLDNQADPDELVALSDAEIRLAVEQEQDRLAAEAETV